MVAIAGNAYYLEQQVTTASRGHLLIMVYEGMLRFLTEAKRAMENKQYELKNNRFQKTQGLLMELIHTLDHAAMPELAANLDRIYRLLYDQLTYANIHDDPQVLASVITSLKGLHEAWVEADQLARRGTKCPVGGFVG